MLASRLIRIAVLSLVLFVGLVAMQPAAPQASAYSTSLENFSTPTAFSEGGCLWGLICNGAPNGHCGLTPNEDIGCAAYNSNNQCHFSCAM